MLWIIIAIIISYLIGSIPTAYIFGRAIKGIDIRRTGSGNIGATNAMRALGKGPGLLVLALDILKGFIATFYLTNIFISHNAQLSKEVFAIILGLSSIFGHNWTIFLGFKGGKGVATTFGVLLGLALTMEGLRVVLIFLTIIWTITFIISRIVSMASLVTAASLPIFTIVLKQSEVLICLSIILSVFVILRHKANIKRLFQGKEKRVTL